MFLIYSIMWQRPSCTAQLLLAGEEVSDLTLLSPYVIYHRAAALDDSPCRLRNDATRIAEQDEFQDRVGRTTVVQ